MLRLCWAISSLSLDASPFNLVSCLILRPSFQQCKWILLIFQKKNRGRVYYLKNIHAFVIAFEERRTHIIRVIIPKGKTKFRGYRLGSHFDFTVWAPSWTGRFGLDLTWLFLLGRKLVSISWLPRLPATLITGDASISVIFSNSFCCSLSFQFLLWEGSILRAYLHGGGGTPGRWGNPRRVTPQIM